MAARSVAELIPRPFAELTLADVAEILSRVGEERESLFFERKASLSAAALAKSCAAFANTAGGLLLGGVGDDSDELVGMEQVSGEAQVWVKDVLRGHLLPLPPFRARWLPVADDRALLLVLVEASSTTPHLLTRNGAIYVRNPGSSDPVPISDQRRLLDLLERGGGARDVAVRDATRIASEAPIVIPYVEAQYVPMTMALVPTGVAAWFESDLLERRASVERVGETLGEDAASPYDHHQRLWEQHSVAVVRFLRPRFYSQRYERLHAIKVWGTGALMFHRAMLAEPEYPGDVGLRREQVLELLKTDFDAGRDLLLDLGAHGDLRFAYRIGGGRSLYWSTEGRHELEHPIQVEDWTTLDFDEGDAAAFLDRVLAAIGRAMGVGPEQ
jgi:hypothetical protein